MLIIELAPLSNGAHRNQTGTFSTVPEGYIAVPSALESEAQRYLPFIDLTIADGILTAVAQGTIPEAAPEPEPEPEPEPTPQQDADAMLVDHEYRLTLLELGVTEEV